MEKNILTLLNESKNHNLPPPLKLNGWSLITLQTNDDFDLGKMHAHVIKKTS